MVKIQFAVQPVGGLNAISIQGDANARVGVLELPASYKPNPKSDSCSANDLSNGQWLAIGLGDSTTGSTPLNGTPPFTIALSKPLEAGVQLCLVALETIAGGTTPYYSPFATVLGAAPVAQSQPAATGTPCAFKADPTQPTPKFEPVDVDPTSNSASGVANNSIAGTVAGAKSGTVQVCLVDESAAGTTSYTALGAPVPVGNGSFSLKLTDIKPPPALKTGQKFVAQFESAATGNATVYGPLSASVIAGDCASDGINPGLIAPILDQTKPPDKGVMAIAGKFASSATPGNVRVCVDGLQQGTPVTVAQFATPGITVPALSPGSVVVAQLISSSVSGALKFGPFSPEVAVGTCTGTGSGDSASKPTLTSVPSLGGQIVTGSVPLDKSGHPIARLVRVCVDKRSIATTALASPNDRQITVAHVNANGNFTATLPDGLNHGERVFVQAITSNPTLAGSPRSYGLPSDFAKPSGFRYSNFFGTYIGGVEESGFSSDNINTNAFISAFIRSNYLGNLGWHHQVGFAPWGRIRLLSAPEQSAPNIVATIANPTGQLTQTTLSSVGAVIDYSIGGELRLRQWDRPSETARISLIGSVGETTPLNTATPNIFNVPMVNTQDCANLLQQYSGTQYSKFLASGAGLSTPGCLENPASGAAYNYVAFTEQKRTGFLFKYGGGVRLTRIVLPKQQGGTLAPYMLDVTLGQDQSITKGKLWGPVFRLDGQLPFPITGATPYLYIFGSSEVRLRQSENLPTINLGTISGTAPAIPSASVIVLPTQQPDRDFYRVGIGFNLTALINSWTSKSSSGVSQAQPSTAPAN